MRLASYQGLGLWPLPYSSKQKNPQCRKRLSNHLNLKRDPKDLACKPAGFERFGLPCRQVIG
jgi:hypothetical protein